MTLAVLRNIDWPCGCRTELVGKQPWLPQATISSGLDWVFHHVERAIILEDDCVPDPSFFSFCEELLERYSDEPRPVSMISGDNFQFGRAQRATVTTSHRPIAHISGLGNLATRWAALQRQCARAEMHRGPWLANVLGHESVAEFYRNLFDRTYLHMLDSWDTSQSGIRQPAAGRAEHHSSDESRDQRRVRIRRDAHASGISTNRTWRPNRSSFRSIILTRLNGISLRISSRSNMASASTFTHAAVRPHNERVTQPRGVFPQIQTVDRRERRMSGR